VGDRVLKVSVWTKYNGAEIDVAQTRAGAEAAASAIYWMNAGRNALQPEFNMQLEAADIDDIKAAKRNLKILDFKGRGQFDRMIELLKASAPKEQPPQPKLPEVLKVEITNPTALQPPPRQVVIKRDRAGNMISADIKESPDAA
jgi:hypothetical protein